MVVSELRGLGIRKERGALVQTWQARVLCLRLALVFCDRTAPALVSFQLQEDSPKTHGEGAGAPVSSPLSLGLQDPRILPSQPKP